MTIDDIARLASVSKATVSAVLNDKPGVARLTRDRVAAIIDRFNYQPSHVARSLSVRSTKSIGLVIKEIDNPYYTRIMRGVFDACSRRGYTVFLGSSELTFVQEEKSIQAMVNQQVDGLILTPLQGGNRDITYLATLIARKFPLVLIGEVKNLQTGVVTILNADAAYEAVSYLIQQGRRDIAYFAGPATSMHNDERYEGYRRALAEHELAISPRYVREAGSYFEGGRKEGLELFGGPGEKPTAVFCYNDLVAIGLINALQELKIRVPEDVAVIGFDNIDFCRYANVPLTTIENPAAAMGEAAADLLIGQIEQGDRFVPERITLNARLIKRSST